MQGLTTGGKIITEKESAKCLKQSNVVEPLVPPPVKRMKTSYVLPVTKKE